MMLMRLLKSFIILFILVNAFVAIGQIPTIEILESVNKVSIRGLSVVTN
jgi:hypothetical protein